MKGFEDMIKLSLIVKKSPIPATLTIISFILFINVYLYINLTTVEPYWLTGLIFAIPFISFGVITYFTTKGRLNKAPSIVISLILTLVLGFVMIVSFFIIALDAATTETTDVTKYQRVLRITDYSNNSLTKYFPSKIPDDAKNITFIYHPAFMQGGEELGLKFETNHDSINNYIDDINNRAIWTGNINDHPSNYGIYLHTFERFGYETLPEDYTIYVIVSDNSNHGELSFVAISKVRNEIIFYADNW